MRTKNLDLLNHPVAQQLLHSKNMARLAYTWVDGTPRVVPLWFQWDGTNILMWTPPTAPKVKALSANPTVAVTIDRNEWPAHILLVRGTAHLSTVPTDAPSYVTMTERYLGAEGSRGWVAQYRQMFPETVQIAIQPSWADVIDMQTRLPSAIARVVAGH